MRRVSSSRWKTRADLILIADRVRTLIETQPARRWTLKQLADASGISPYHLQRTFASAYGISPVQLQKQIRMNHACQLLRAGQPPKRVCEQLGFASQPSFAREFRHVFGVSPSEVREQ